METKFNFNSSVCTDRSQSERLLALGLKKETADMFWMEDWKFNDKTREPYFTGEYKECIKRSDQWVDFRDSIPAWSLHRLIEMTHKNTIDNNAVVLSRNQTYDQLIGRIARQIKEGYFNKEYLENPLTIEDVLEQSRRQGRTTIRVIPKGKEE